MEVISQYWRGFCHPAAQPFAGAGMLNHGVFDFFSIVHMLAGVAFGVLGVGFAPTFALAAAWEIVEHVLKDACPVAFIHPTQDTVVNVASDVIVALVGWSIGGRWSGRRTTGLAS